MKTLLRYSQSPHRSRGQGTFFLRCRSTHGHGTNSVFRVSNLRLARLRSSDVFFLHVPASYSPCSNGVPGWWTWQSIDCAELDASELRGPKGVPERPESLVVQDGSQPCYFEIRIYTRCQRREQLAHGNSQLQTSLWVILLLTSTFKSAAIETSNQNCGIDGRSSDTQ